MKNCFEDKINEISKNGFCSIDKFFNEEILNNIQNTILDLYLLQAQKINTYHNQILDLSQSMKLKERDPKKTFKALEFILELMEKDDKEALYQVQKFFNESPLINTIITSELLDFCSLILKCKKSEILFNGPSLFINKPNSQRLLYKWHSESHYYPKRRRFLNLWIPLFTKKTIENGTMSFKVGSHKRDFPFSQYQGYNKDSRDKVNYFVQYEIPKNFLENYPDHFCLNSPGDLVVFHKRMVHSSNINKSSEFSFALVMRIWTPIDDLTLSGDISAKPYDNDMGSPGLIVSPECE